MAVHTRTRAAMELEGAGPVLLELHGRLLRLVSARAGHHFQGWGAAAGWLARRGSRDKALKTMRQLDVVAAWVRHATGPKSEETVAAVRQLMDVLDLLTGEGADEANMKDELMQDVSLEIVEEASVEVHEGVPA